MHFRFSKKVISVIISLFVIILIALLSTLPFTKDVDCFKNEDFCEKFVIDKDHRSIQTYGTVIKKYFENNIYYLLIDTKGNNQQSTVLLYRLPPENLKVFTTINYKDLSQPKILTSSPPEVFNMIQPNERIGLSILTPSNSEIKEAGRVLPDKNYASCFKEQKAVTSFLSHPSMLSWIQFKIHQATANCAVNLTSVSIIR